MPGSILLPHASDELSLLRARVARLEALASRRGRALALTGAALLTLGLVTLSGASAVRGQLASCRAKLVESRQGHSALARARGEVAPVRYFRIPVPADHPA